MKRPLGPGAASLALVSVMTLSIGIEGCRACQRDLQQASVEDAGANLRRVDGGAGEAVASRCRPVGAPVPLGETSGAADTIAVGDIAVGERELLVGLHRVHEGRRVASILRASLDLTNVRRLDLGAPFGDDPPPLPRWRGRDPMVVAFGREASDGGPKRRQLRISKLSDEGGMTVEMAFGQPTDESNDIDLAWTSSGAGLAAWDEDAPGTASRGVITVRTLPEGSPRVVTVETTDAESPKLALREGGGYWLGYVAQRKQTIEHAMEGPGEARTYRWVEVLALSASGEPLGAPRRVSAERGHVVAFDLVPSENGLLLAVHDEASALGDSGGRVVRIRFSGERVESSELARGVGHAGADLALRPNARAGGREAAWLSWSDASDRPMLLALRAGMEPHGLPSVEPLLDGARVLHALAGDELVALVGTGDTQGSPRRTTIPALQRLSCTAR